MAQSIASVGSDLWPSISSAWSKPRRLLRRVHLDDAPLLQNSTSRQLSRRVASEQASASPSASAHGIALPDCLQQVPMATLRSSLASSGLRNRTSTWTPFARRSVWASSNLPRINPPSSPHPPSLQQKTPFSVQNFFFGSTGKGPGRSSIQKRTFATTFQPASQNMLAHAERTANNNPTSATAQSAFYSALLRANMPKIIIERYQTGRYASNPAADATYLKALQMTGSAPTPGASGNMGAAVPGAVSQDTLQAVGQAVAAQSYGGQ